MIKGCDNKEVPKVIRGRCTDLLGFGTYSAYCACNDRDYCNGASTVNFSMTLISGALLSVYVHPV